MRTHRSSERGNATVKFLLVMLTIGATAYVGYLYVPVALGAHNVKDMMQHYVDLAYAEGKPPTWASEQMVKKLAKLSGTSIDQGAAV